MFRPNKELLRELQMVLQGRQPRKICLLGATGFIGSSVLQTALDRGHEVTAIVRDPDKVKLDHRNLLIVKVTIFNANRLARYIGGCDVIVSCLGSEFTLFGDVRLYSDATRAVVGAMRKLNINRLVFLSSWFVEDADGHPLMARLFIKPFKSKMFEDMLRAERYLTNECPDINFTAIRPPQVTEGMETGREILVQTDVDYSDSMETEMSRADLAKCVLMIVERNLYPRRSALVGYALPEAKTEGGGIKGWLQAKGILLEKPIENSRRNSSESLYNTDMFCGPPVLMRRY